MMIIRKIILGIIPIAACMSSFAAETVSRATPEQDMEKAADQGLQQPKTDPDKVLQNRLVDDYVSEISEALSIKYKNRLAGMYVEHEPYSRLVVRLVGNVDEPNRTLTVPQAKHVQSKQRKTPLIFKVEFQGNQPYTLKQLTEMLSENLDKYAEIYPDIQGAYVDERNGEIVLDLIKDPNDQTKRDQANKVLNIPVSVNELHGALVRQAGTVHGVEVIIAPNDD